MSGNKKVAYFYHDRIADFNYGEYHPMKPKRIKLTHDLIVGYGIYKEMDVYRPQLATSDEISLFHDPDYVKFLELSAKKLKSELQPAELEIINDVSKKKKYKIGLNTDCPVFEGLYEFCQLSCGASFDSAILLAEQQADVCINYAGGLHHAKKKEASGFCYANDIVIGILCLLKYFQRVLYVDIDVHHGDGVEEAFFTTNRVMTVSFHQYGDGFFPGSGDITSIGEGDGKGYTVNVPLKPGITTEQYVDLFKNVIQNVYNHFRPNVVFVQSGADSIIDDKLGQFNMSSKGHGECIKYIQELGIPCILVGGGGYTIENVARCWVNETALTLGIELPEKIPEEIQTYQVYKPDFQLSIKEKPNIENKNEQKDLQRIKELIDQHLKDIEPVPGTQIVNTYVPDIFKNSSIQLQQIQEQQANEMDMQLENMPDQRNDAYFSQQIQKRENIMQ